MNEGDVRGSDGYRQFLELHKGQLDALSVPSNLYEKLYIKLYTQCFDGFEHFGVVEDEDNTRQCEYLT